jgi:hypothetical protein
MEAEPGAVDHRSLAGQLRAFDRALRRPFERRLDSRNGPSAAIMFVASNLLIC